MADAPSSPTYLPYSPQTTKAQTVPVSSLTSHNIHSVRITWVDFGNSIRFRVIPLSSFQRLLASSRPGITVAQGSFGLVLSCIVLAPGFNATGEYLYVVDLDTIRLCPYAPGHVSIMGWFQDKTPVPGRALGTGVPMCPRSVLKRVIDTATSYNAAFLVGFESEFILLKSTNPVEAVNTHGCSISSALASGTKETEVMEEIAQGLVDSGVELMMYHSEAAPGQYEVVTGPLPPLEAADALVHTRETIANVANKHGLRATFAPRINLDNCGNGAHTHISVHPISSEQPSVAVDKTRAQSDNLLTPLEHIFLAGVLEHLPAACAFTLPVRASYARMVDGICSGGTWIAWGSDNREVPVRLCVPPTHFPIPAQQEHAPPTPSGNHFEIKCIDGTSSPYLALSGLLGAGLLGIQSQAPLVEKNCTEAAAEMSEADRDAVGVRRRLPLTWEEARGALEGDEA
ncbi:glutamine synthetase/guanido kinase, partial [Rhizopogon vinicolor AM-OR11-026]